jgi:hypothetical protein
VTVSCASNDPNAFRYCDQSQYDIPFRSDFKLAGSYSLVWGTQVGVAFASYPGCRSRELVGPCKPFSRRPYAVGHRQPGPARQ